MPIILRIVYTLSSAIIFLSSSRIAFANYTFSDYFDTGQISNEWQTIPSHPLPTVTSDTSGIYARFLSPNGTRVFPYIAHTHNQEVISMASFDFYYDVGGATQGSGIMLSSFAPIINQSPPNDSGDYIFGLWNINGYHYLLSPLCDNIGGCGMSIYSRAIAKLDRGIWNRIEVKYTNNLLIIRLNDVDIANLPTSSASIVPRSLWIGNPVYATNPQSWLPFSVDNVTIKYGLEQLSPFSYFSQRDPEWKDLPYDSASEWAGNQANSIERWGCAITSVAMVLKEYAIKMPNGDIVNPEKINTWLMSQPDGYIGNGLLNWLAISRLVRNARDGGHADTDLEFVKSYGSPSDEISSGKYPIIDEAGHFVTLYDQDVDSYILNDPNDASRSSKLKTELIRSVNTYSPSNTDLSYIMLVSEEGVSIETKHNDNAVGETYQEEIIDDIGGSSSGKFRVVYIPKPGDGDYKLSINNAGIGSSIVNIYSYDKDGNVDKTEQTVPTGISEWVFSYHSDGTDPVITELDSTPPTYVGTNSFSGWYNTPQTATFNFEDLNLPSDFVPPTCTISAEGNNKTCSINVAICDKYNNCKTYSLNSNPANIDLTPPTAIKKIWGIGMRPFSIVTWTPSKDATKYIIEWGVEKNSLTNKMYVSDHWAWVPTPRTKQIYVRISAEDRAGNVSKTSKVEKISVHPHYWRW